ncbi:hypothetical protein ACQP04_23340 [Pseudonocardia halophobica]
MFDEHACSVRWCLLLLGTPGGALAAMSTTGLVWLAWRYPNVFTGSSPS